MDARTVLIIMALFAVLLSAFGVERYHACQGNRACLAESAVTLLPAARFITNGADRLREERLRTP